MTLNVFGKTTGIFVVLCFLSIGYVDGVCSFPKEWNSVWYDSWSGNVSIVRSLGIVIGWEVEIYSVTLDSWTCQYDDKENNYLVFKADNQVNMNGTLNNAYLCLKWQYITDYSYVYYLQSDINRHAGNSRILLTEDSILQPNDTSGYCSPKFGPTVEEFRILVKKGKESEVKQKCSSELLGTFHYIYTDNKETTCVEESTLDVCKTGNTMIFNYTQCGTVQAYSAEGEVYCVYNVSDGISNFVSMLNPGVVDGVIYHRFTCYAVTDREILIPPSIQQIVRLSATQNPNVCYKGQTSFSKPPDGAILSLISKDTCPNITISSTTVTTTTHSFPITTTTTFTTTGIKTSSELTTSSGPSPGTTGNFNTITGQNGEQTWITLGVIFAIALGIILIILSVVAYRMVQKNKEDDDEVFYHKDDISLDPDAEM